MATNQVKECIVCGDLFHVDNELDYTVVGTECFIDLCNRIKALEDVNRVLIEKLHLQGGGILKADRMVH